MDDLSSAIPALKKLIDASATVKSHAGSLPFVIIDSDQKVTDLENLMPFPARKRGCPKFTQVGSFVTYVNEHKTKETRIYACSEKQVVAVIDHHGSGDNPRWGQHRAEFNLSLSVPWKTWSGKNTQSMGQRDFAQFIEDNADDVSRPNGAAMLDLVRTIKASQNVQCTGQIEEKAGNGNTSFSISTRTKAGVNGDLELPDTFELKLAVYEGSEPHTIQARLRFAITGDGKLTLWYELVRVERFLRASLESVIDQIAEETEIEPFYGTP